MALFTKNPKTPFFDYVRRLTPSHAAQYLETHPRTRRHLGAAIGLITMQSAAPSLSQKSDWLRSIKAGRDILAFEMVVFAAFAIRRAYEPRPPRGEEDDEQFYADHFDEFMNEAFKDGLYFISRIADHACGWNTLAVIQRRLITYLNAPSTREATESLIAILGQAGGAEGPKIEYSGPPKLDLSESLALMTGIGSFAAAIPAPYANMIRDISRAVEWTD